MIELRGVHKAFGPNRVLQGVGAATKSAVVAASVAILAANYVLTGLFFTS